MDATRGGMVAVALTPAELQPLLDECGLDLAAVNAPDLCVASGSEEALDRLAARAGELGVEAHRVRIHIAAHSRLLDPVLQEFRTFLRGLQLRAPQIPWVSNRTGTWVTDEQATDPEYWVGQLRNTVQFSAGIGTLAAQHPTAVFVEVGPGKTLSSLARLNTAFTGTHAAVHTVRHPDESRRRHARAAHRAGPAVGDRAAPSRSAAGIHIRHSQPAQPADVRVPEPALLHRAGAAHRRPTSRRAAPARPIARPISGSRSRCGTRSPVVEQCRRAGHGAAVRRSAGHRGPSQRRACGNSGTRWSPCGWATRTAWCRPPSTSWPPNTAGPRTSNSSPTSCARARCPTVCSTWRCSPSEKSSDPGLSFFHRNQELGFYNLVFFMQAWAAEGLRRPLHLVVATANAQRATAWQIG
jgi:hypothetical protein